MLLTPDSAWEHSAGLDGHVCATHAVSSSQWLGNLILAFIPRIPRGIAGGWGVVSVGSTIISLGSLIQAMFWLHSDSKVGSRNLELCASGFPFLFAREVVILNHSGVNSSPHSLWSLCVNLQSQETSLSFPPFLEVSASRFVQDYPRIILWCPWDCAHSEHPRRTGEMTQQVKHWSLDP